MSLQPLRIPSGWGIEYNHFSENNPSDYPNPENDVWFFEFVEDILLIRRKTKDIILDIDLGWYPEGNPNGNFVLYAIKNNNWDCPLKEFVSRDRLEVLNKIEEWLEYYSNY